eukprot:m.112212 g.112212  ORF g.112212 m.112212 type:complete len:1026 (+) comp14086_c0_seq4:217-3294(+)
MAEDRAKFVFETSILRWYVRTSVRRPCTVATIGLAVPIVISMIAFAAFPLEIDTGGGTFYPRSSEIGTREDTLKLAPEVTVFNPLANVSDVIYNNSSMLVFVGTILPLFKDEDEDSTIPRQSNNQYSLSVIFWRSGETNIFTQEGFDLVKKVEERILAHEDNGKVYSDFCLRDGDGQECLPPTSLITYLYAEKDPNCSDILIPNGKGSTMLDIQDTLYQMQFGNGSDYPVFCYPEGKKCDASCVDPDESSTDEFVAHYFDVEKAESHITKSTFRFGLPLQGYNNAKDRYDEQISKIEDFVSSMKEYLDSAGEHGITVRYLSPILIQLHFQDLIFRDTLWIVLSIVLVFLFMWFHIQSAFLASFGIVHVILSFPFAYFFLQALLRSGSMGVLNFMSLFIILGIGADDIFIYIDSWKQSKYFVARSLFPQDEEGHIAWTEARFTYAYRRSAWAMLVTSLTTSGAFLMNLTSSVPPIQIFGFFTAFMVITNYLMVISYYPALVIFWSEKIENLFTCGCFKGESMKLETVKGRKPSIHDINAQKLRPLEKFFHFTYAPGVAKRKYLIMVSFLGFLVVSIIYASQLESATEPTKWLPDDDTMQHTFNIDATDFTRPTGNLQVWFVHGLNRINRGGTNRFDAADLGKTSFDTNFDPSSPNFQTVYLDMCNMIRNNPSTRDGEVSCPLELFRDYVMDVLNETFPVPHTEFVRKLANFTEYLEVVNGPSPDFSTLTTTDDRNDRRSGRRSTASTYDLIRFEPGNPDKLLYLAAVGNLTLGFLDPISGIGPVYDSYEDLINQMNSNESYAAVTLNRGFQSSSRWVDYELDRVLLQSALTGIGASIAIAFLIVLISTTDVLLTILTLVAIGGTVASLIAMMVWIGWKMSVIESICLTILVGLSVDYTIHLANSWRNAKVSDRVLRLQITLTEIGISVLSASITTFLSCCALFLTTILFFVKFGYFIALTILFSTLYAFGLFSALIVFVARVDNRNDFYDLYCLLTGKPLEPSNTDQPEDDKQYMANRENIQVASV